MNVRPLILNSHGDHTSKIVLVVADGLGGLALEPSGRTELEIAQADYLDQVSLGRLEAEKAGGI